jgi:hypothetical protein
VAVSLHPARPGVALSGQFKHASNRLDAFAERMRYMTAEPLSQSASVRLQTVVDQFRLIRETRKRDRFLPREDTLVQLLERTVWQPSDRYPLTHPGRTLPQAITNLLQRQAQLLQSRDSARFFPGSQV